MLKRYALLVVGLFGVTSAWAQAPAPAPRMQSGETLAELAAAHYPQPVQVASLLHRTVLAASESRNVVGHVLGVVRQDNQVKVVVDYGGVLGFGGRPVAVPVQAMVLILHSMEIVGLTPDQLRRLPTFDDAGATRLAPQDVIKVGLARPTH